MRGERLDWGLEAEALSRRCVQVPYDAVDISVVVAAEASLAWQVSPHSAVAVLDAAALPRAMRVAEEGAKADGISYSVMPGKLATIIVGDGFHRG